VRVAFGSQDLELWATSSNRQNGLAASGASLAYRQTSRPIDMQKKARKLRAKGF
jgi:hypothetical protein